MTALDVSRNMVPFIARPPVKTARRYDRLATQFRGGLLQLG